MQFCGNPIDSKSFSSFATAILMVVNYYSVGAIWWLIVGFCQQPEVKYFLVVNTQYDP